MSTTIGHSSRVCPAAVTLPSSWQPTHSVATISLPFPSGKPCAGAEATHPSASAAVAEHRVVFDIILFPDIEGDRGPRLDDKPTRRLAKVAKVNSDDRNRQPAPGEEL